MSRYPRLEEADLISIDIETQDPNLTTHGPSNYRTAIGRILGVAIAAGNHAEYYNYRHGHDLQYIKYVCELPVPKIGHSLIYDVDWLESEDIPVNGDLIDIMIAEALIDNNQESYKLDTIAQNYLKETKEDTEIINALHNIGVTPTKSKPAQNYLHLLLHDVVRPYAIQDVTIPLKVYPRMKRFMENMGLIDLFKLECELIRVLLYMRRIGVQYDVKKSLACTEEVNSIYKETVRLLKANYGNPNVNSAQEISYVFNKLGIAHPYTDKGNPSVTRDFLEHLIEEQNLEHYSVIDYFPLLVHNARRLGKSEGNYISGIRHNFMCSDNRTIRCTFHQTRDADNFGTVSGRFSCSKPNLQQITSKERDDFLGGLCRRPFIPEEGCDWVKIDYSQIEYRVIAHYAKGPGSNEIRESYNHDPTTDYHKYIQDLTGLIRPIAKNLNFGIAFGMGPGKMQKIYGWDDYKTWEILNTYHSNAPFVKYSMNDVGKVAKRRGYIRTILGRVAQLPSPRQSYIMFNRLIQGSAADLIKKSMVDIYKSGLLSECRLHLTVHDELDFSIPKGDKQLGIIEELQAIMSGAIELKVPIIAEASIGPNWGDVEKVA